jgi:hypothetical protein
MKLHRTFRNLKRMELEPRFRKRLFVFLAVGFTTLFFMGALGIWGAVKVYQSAKTYALSPVVQDQLDSLKGDLSEFPAVKGLSCLDKTQTLLSLRPWIENTWSHNLIALKDSCLESKINNCSGPECGSEHVPIENGKEESI